MFLKKTPKPKGTYLAITESYYDKEKKATRQKTIMGLGYLEELRKEFPDPIAHFEKVVTDMNQEREEKKNSVVYFPDPLSAASMEGRHKSGALFRESDAISGGRPLKGTPAHPEIPKRHSEMAV